MARTNTVLNQFPNVTHEGAPAYKITAEQELRRSIMACLLWEDTFYESGVSIADRIASLVPQVVPEKVSAIAIEARSKMYLRHAPLYLVREMARHKEHRKYVRHTLSTVIQRADELAEFLSIYWKDKKQPIAASVKKGLSDAFGKFNEFQFAKYNRDNPIKLRDVMFLVHPKPTSPHQADLYKKIAENNLATPDTWEVALSIGQDKKATWVRLIEEKKLGGLALLRNLRNMQQVGVPDPIISDALKNMNTSKILPFRFLAALEYAPQFVTELDGAMLKSLADHPKLAGRTVICVDVSGSMNAALSQKSDMTRVRAAEGLAVLAREICDSAKVIAFGTTTREVPAYRGLALADAIHHIHTSKEIGWGTNIGGAVSHAGKLGYDRIIVITDEQSHDPVRGPKTTGYMINVGTYKNGIGYGPWIHIDGWSDRVLDYVTEMETNE